MFLSEAYNNFHLAEAIVHEFHHSELYILMVVQETLEQRANELFYSPWRHDPRPLYGLFHALYVFSGVANFYARAETISDLEPHKEQFRQRRLQICHQLRLGLAQVPDNRLAPVGCSIIESIQADLNRHEAALGPLSRELPAPLAAHLKSWRAANPDLASRVRMPQ
jgi:HEXXH motif-containing protein